MKYTSNRDFKIWSYTVSHSFLLLRSPMFFEDMEGYSEDTNYNIDIEFYSVVYIEIPNKMKGISVQKIDNHIPLKLKEYASSENLGVFEIKSEERSSFIVAAGYRVGKNKWVTEDRISNIRLEHDEILFSS